MGDLRSFGRGIVFSQRRKDRKGATFGRPGGKGCPPVAKRRLSSVRSHETDPGSQLILQKFHRFCREFFAALLDFCWPPNCLLCASPLESGQELVCLNCLAEIKSHAAVCRRCGSSIDAGSSGSTRPGGNPTDLCPDCRRVDPPFARARSFGPHVPPLSTLLYHFKYRHRPELTHILGSLLRMLYIETGWKEIDLLVAVPTTRWRAWRRGYNQAALLAKHLAMEMDLPYLEGSLGRKGGGSQVGSSLISRSKNVRGAFYVRENQGLLHKEVLLVDDVLTTGATAREVTNALIAAGARQVYLLTLTSTGRKRGWGMRPVDR